MATLYLNPSPPPVPWLSPALSIYRPSGPNAGLDTVAYTDLNPATKPQFARAIAGAAGAGSVTGTKVQLWACAYGTAPAGPLFLPSLGGVGGVTAGEPGVTLTAPTTDAFDFPWDRDSGLIASEVQQFADPDGNVHTCLYGNAYGNGDGNARTSLAVGPDAFDTANNPHHAQHNITIRAAPPGKLIPMMLWAGNPEPKKDRPFEFEVVERPPRELMVWEVDAITEAHPWLVKTQPPFRDRLTIPTFRELPQTLRRVPQDVTRFFGSLRVSPTHGRTAGREIAGLNALVDGRRVPLLTPKAPLRDLSLAIDDGLADRRQTFELGADDARPARIHFDVPSEEFVLRVVDVIQRDENGGVAGGARVVLIAAPTEVTTKGRR